MFTTQALRATSNRIPLTLTQASAQLVPPIPLYRRLLRAHRKLPLEMRYMGDSYVKSEFRATRSTDNALHIMAFLSQWKGYLDEVESSLAAADGDGMKAWKGRKLDHEVMESLSAEQVGQLYELMHASGDVWKSPEELEAGAQAAEAEHTDAEKNSKQ